MLTHALAAPSAPGRVVILGGSGFVGRAVRQALSASGTEVLVSSTPDLDLEQASAVPALLAFLRADDAVVMIAARTPDRGRDVATLMRNLEMARHVGDALRRCPVAHFVYLSSDAVYADDVNPVDEESTRHPGALYGLMHVAREQMLQDAAAEAGTPCAVLRPSLLYGPSDPHNSYGPNRFLKTALTSRLISLFGEGEEQRDHVWLADLARLIEQVLRWRSAGVLNVATGQSLSFRAVAETIRTQVPGVELRLLPRNSPIAHRHFDTTAVTKAFPRFRFTSFAAGMAATAEAERAR